MINRWTFYRLLMRLAHRFNWHYAPMIGPIEPGGGSQRWCQWCGFRESYRQRTPALDATGPSAALVGYRYRHTGGR